MASKPRSDARCRILRAAEAVVRRLGARHLTLDAAAQEAGVSKGGVLYHFPGKQALLEAMIDRAIAELSSRTARHRTALAGGPNPTLRAILRAGREVMAEDLELRTAMLAAVGENPALLEPVRAAIACRWQAVRDESADPIAAYLIWGAMEGQLFLASFGIAPIAADQIGPYFDRLDAMAEALPARNPRDVA